MGRLIVFLCWSFLFFSAGASRAEEMSRSVSDADYRPYMWKADYKKAVEILKQGLEKEPNNDTYWYDLGNIYLVGLNDLESAEKYIVKAIEINPQHRFAYPSLGYIYEKKGDVQKAKEYYHKAMTIAPIQEWTNFASNHLRSMELSQLKAFMTDWLVLGPIPLSVTLPSLENLKNHSIVMDTQTFDWQSCSKVYSGFISFNEIFETNDFVSAFALTYVYSMESQQVLLLFGSDDNANIWINDILIADKISGGPALADRYAIPIHLETGWNSIMVQVFDEWGDWGFFCRITDMDREMMDTLAYATIPNNKYIEQVHHKARQRQIQHMLEILGWIMMGGAPLLGIGYILFKRAELVKLKKLFFDGMSHELRTPLASIQACIETIETSADSAKKEEYLKYVSQESYRLSLLVNNILNFSKLNKNISSEYLRFEKIEIQQVLRNIVELFKKQIYPDTVDIPISVPVDPVFVDMDYHFFSMAIFNLLHNAYKYSAEVKKIEIEVVKNLKTISIFIKDSGIGISQAELKKIFRPFYRIGEKDRRGVGLGLALTHAIIKRHFGKISVSSEIGSGSTFMIELKESLS